MTQQPKSTEMVTVYSKNICPHCIESVKILESKGIDHQVIKVDGNDEVHRFLIAKGHKSVPQFYSGSNYLGDYYSYIKNL